MMSPCSETLCRFTQAERGFQMFAVSGAPAFLCLFYASLDRDQMWCCGEKAAFPSQFSTRPPTVLLQLFGCHSPRRTSESHLSTLRQQGNTANYTTHCHTAGSVLLIMWESSLKKPNINFINISY